MRTAYFIAITSLMLCGGALAENWQVSSGEHFLVYYSDEKAFADEVLSRAERYYAKIANDIGYIRYDKFWQWDDRVKIYIYPTREEYVKAIGSRSKEWSSAMVLYKEKKILSYRQGKDFPDTALPHEITHLIFNDFVGVKQGLPLWLYEGVALWEEEYNRPAIMKIVKELVNEGSYIPIDKLTRTDVRFETDASAARKFYAQGAALVGYLIEIYGGERFTSFCRQLRDGKGINEALSFSYTGQIADMNELERQWKAHYGGG